MLLTFITRRPKLTIILGVLIIGGIVLAATLSSGRSATPTTTSMVIDTGRKTSFASAFTGQADTAALDSGTGNGDPNFDAVFQPVTIFNPATLPIPSDTLYKFHEDISSLISQQVIPTYALSYIQIDNRTVKCDTKYDCSLSFYLDSPERYFTYHMYLLPNGEETSDLKQVPLPGIDQ